MPFDALARRSRFSRSPIGKRILLGERDYRILHWLYRYRYLRQSDLVSILKPKSVKRFIERLGDLYHETGIIDRPELHSAGFVSNGKSMLYETTNAGIDMMGVQNALPDRAVTFSRRPPRSYKPQLQHTMMIIDTLLGIELTTLNTPGQRFVPVDEILARASEDTRQAHNPLSVPLKLNGRSTHLIPDALYGIEHLVNGEKGYRFWALECERTTPAWRSDGDRTSITRKREAYDVLIASKAYREHWGIPNLKLHLVTPDRGDPER